MVVGSMSREDVMNRLRFLVDECKEMGVNVVRSVGNPPQFKRFADGATRTGQVVAFLFLGPVVVVSLRLIVVLNELMVAVLGVTPLGAGQDPIFAWLVTALTGGAFVLAAWAWFQFVRTAGFGWFSLEGV